MKMKLKGVSEFFFKWCSMTFLLVRESRMTMFECSLKFMEVLRVWYAGSTSCALISQITFVATKKGYGEKPAERLFLSFSLVKHYDLSQIDGHLFHCMTEFEGFKFTSQRDSCQSIKKAKLLKVCVLKHHCIAIHSHCAHSIYPIAFLNMSTRYTHCLLLKPSQLKINAFSYHIWNLCYVWSRLQTLVQTKNGSP